MSLNLTREKILHWAFRMGILLKGLDGLLELVGGVLFLVISQSALTHFVFVITQGELMEDPDDLVANSLRHTFSHLSDGSKIFVAAYLLGHGVVKVLLVAGLWREKRIVFPIACVVLLGFIGYQIYRLTGSLSAGLCLLTLLDMVILGLIWHEYRYTQRYPRHPAKIVDREGAA